jgi:hypothetical protein
MGLVYGLNVTFDDSDYTSAPGPDVPVILQQYNLPVGALAEEAKPAAVINASAGSAIDPPAFEFPPDEFFDPEDTAWRTHRDQPQPRLRPNYQFAVSESFEGEAEENPEFQHNRILSCMLTMDEAQAGAFDVCLTAIQETNPRWSTYTNACFLLALHAQKDVSWVKALKTEFAPEAIAALEAEFASLESAILTRLEPGRSSYHAEYGPILGDSQYASSWCMCLPLTI